MRKGGIGDAHMPDHLQTLATLMQLQGTDKICLEAIHFFLPNGGPEFCRASETSDLDRNARFLEITGCLRDVER